MNKTKSENKAKREHEAELRDMDERDRRHCAVDNVTRITRLLNLPDPSYVEALMIAELIAQIAREN